MRCPRCQNENPLGSRFCNGCGARLDAVCPRCRQVNPPGSRFCNGCGAEIGQPSGAVSTSSFASPDTYTPRYLQEKILTSRAALEGERKQVTVLFADLKGSMELLAGHDPEEARRLLDPVLELMMEAVHRYEGTVNQVMGDGIMALFGAPLAHEDHAVRACYAALRMQLKVKDHADGLRRTRRIGPQIRVGLNSGEVVVRSIGSDLHMDYTAVGQTTHVAARMEQMAAPGSILLSAHTLASAEGYVEVKALGPTPVKGLDAPLEVYELSRAATIRSRFQAAAVRGLTRFVGRDGEIEQLGQALERAQAGHGQVVAVVGEAGVGKSRLYWEFSHSPRAQRWLVLQSGSVSYGKATNYLPIIELLRAYFSIESADDARKIRDKVTGKLLSLDRRLEPCVVPALWLLDVPVEDEQWPRLDPVQRRQRVLDGVKRLLLRESHAQPVMVLFEDLHWIDAETQAFLDSFVESLPTARVLLLVNYRPEYRHSWGGKTFYQQLHIDPLSVERAEAVLDALLGRDAALAPLKRLVIEQTQGNPFFIEESVRSLVETGVLAGEQGKYRPTRIVEGLQVPATAHAMVAARIDRLTAENKRLLQAASVIGTDVPFELLSAVADETEDRLRRGLAELQATEFLYETRLFPDLEYTFKHALTHDVAYSSVLLDRRRALHARVLHAIETFHAERLTEHAEQLAQHAWRGEQWDKAVRYGRQAGWKSFARSANREATGYLEQALAASSHLPETAETRAMAIDLRLDLYSTMLPLGQLRELLVSLREAEALADALHDQARLGWTRLHICHMLVLIDDCSAGMAVGQDALAVGEAIGDRALQVVAILWLGCACYALGDHQRAVDFLREGLRRLEASEQASAFVATAFPALRIPLILRAYLSMFLAEMGEFGEADVLAVEALQLAEAMDHPQSLATACWQVAHYHLARGQLDRALALLERGSAVGREWGYARVTGLNDVPLGLALALSGRPAEGLAAIERGMDATETIDYTWLRGRRLTVLGEVRLLAGDVDGAEAAADQALVFCRERKERGFEAWALRLLGAIESRRQPLAAPAAEDRYRASLALSTELAMRPLVAHCHLGLGELYRCTGRRDEAQLHLGTASTMYRDMEMVHWQERVPVA
jgi:class 3 adenylate cyclase/tetratricopeptide (TPR) repeat protein